MVLQKLQQSNSMKAMVLEKVGAPLVLQDLPIPSIKPTEVLIRVEACGVCRTDLHIADGELKNPQLPLVLGHQVVGIVVDKGSEVVKLRPGDYVGVPWLGGCCFNCSYCLAGKENLCDEPVFTGFNRPGGFAEYCTADEAFVLPIPPSYPSVAAAPLLCAGLVGYRAFSKLSDAQNIGFYGFGSSAHITLQVARAFGKKVYVFTKPGDLNGQQFARTLGATWAGGSDTLPPEPLDGALVFAPVGALMVEGLKAVKKGSPVISVGIHMSDIPSFPYELLWGERSLTSVANLTRQDGIEFMSFASKIPLDITVTEFPLEKANEALAAIRDGSLVGSAILKINAD
jgi:propanol-preferring alcohol dehydrogenase